MLEAQIAWICLLSLLFVSVGLFGRVVGTLPLHYAAVSSITAICFVKMYSVQNWLWLPALGAMGMACIAVLFSAVAVTTTRWLRDSEVGKLVFMIASGNLISQLIAFFDGYKFYGVSFKHGLSQSHLDLEISIAAGLLTFCIAAFFDAPRRARLLAAISENRGQALLIGISVKKWSAVALTGSASALTVYSLGTTFIRGHMVGIDSNSVIAAASVAYVNDASKIWHFAALGVAFASARVLCGWAFGAVWQDTATMVIAYIYVVVLIRLRNSRNDLRRRSDEIHSSFSNNW